MTRTDYIRKNIYTSVGTAVFVFLLGFVNRTFIVKFLGADYLGFNSLFANILGILSLSELGIGTVINFSLYEPIAKNETEKIKSLMVLYKKIYLIIAVVVFSLGIILLPFLHLFCKTDVPMVQIRIYYLFFLFNTGASYFIVYKTAYVSALQKEYIVTLFNSISQIFILIVQCIVLFVMKNYIVYLAVQLFFGILQKISMTIYINKKFPILTKKSCKKIERQTVKTLKRNIKASILHQIGGVVVHQTDSIIISSFISVTVVGVMSNYIMLSSFASKIQGMIFNGMTASLGNLIACEDEKKVNKIFSEFTFFSFAINGFICCLLFVLSSPFIRLWFGFNYVLNDFTLSLFYLLIYLQGESLPVHKFKVAGGIFSDDRYVPIVQAIVNIVFSIFFVKIIGLPGVYLGSILQRLIVVIFWPYLVCKKILHVSAFAYFFKYILRLFFVVIVCCCLLWFQRKILFPDSVVTFMQLTVLSVLFYICGFLLFFGREPELRSILSRVFKTK